MTRILNESGSSSAAGLAGDVRSTLAVECAHADRDLVCDTEIDIVDVDPLASGRCGGVAWRITRCGGGLVRRRGGLRL